MPQEKIRREKSYYEVALSSGQVVVALAGLIGCLFLAFAAGVWTGRGGAQASASLAAEPSSTQVSAPPANVPTMNLFSEEDSGGPRPASEPSNPGEPSTSPQPSDTATEPSTTGDLASSDLPQRLDVAPPLAEDAPPVPGAAASPGLEPGGDGAPRFHRRQKVADEANRLEAEFERERAELTEADASARETSPAPATSGAPGPSPAAPLPSAASPVPPAAAPQPEVKRPAASGTFVVQVLSTKDQARARRVLGLLQESGYPASLSTVNAAGATSYRIRVGPYRDRAGAEKAAGEVKLKFQLDTWITSD